MWKGQAPRGYNGVRWNYMEYLVEINKKKQKAENIVQRHDSTEFVDAERVKKGFMFGSSSDGGRLYFDLNDNLSIWEYWLYLHMMKETTHLRKSLVWKSFQC